MVPSRVIDADVLAIWRRMEGKCLSVRIATSEFGVGLLVGISKEKKKFAKAADQNFSTEIFRIFKVIDRRVRTFY